MTTKQFSMLFLAFSMKDLKKKHHQDMWIFFFCFQIHILTRFFILSFVSKSFFSVPSISSVLLHSIPLRGKVWIYYTRSQSGGRVSCCQEGIHVSVCECGEVTELSKGDTRLCSFSCICSKDDVCL